MLPKLSAFATQAQSIITTGKFSDSLPGVSSTVLDEESLSIVQKNTDKIAIIGSGWLGRALSKRLVEANYDVVIGSRNPLEKLKTNFEVMCEFVSIPEACQYADIIILAIPYSGYPSLLQTLAINGKDKVVIDCSNRKPDKKCPISVAEELQRNLPHCHIVKAFNDTSAYELSQEDSGVMDKTLRYCGDNQASKEVVRTLMDHIGMNSRDAGALRSARTMEAAPFKFFGEWQSSMIIAIPTLVFIVMYSPRWYWFPGAYRDPFLSCSVLSCANSYTQCTTWCKNDTHVAPLHTTLHRMLFWSLFVRSHSSSLSHLSAFFTLHICSSSLFLTHSTIH